MFSVFRKFGGDRYFSDKISFALIIIESSIQTYTTMKGTEDSQPSNVLLLGMVFAHQATEPKRGQEYRDRVRCESVQELGFQVYTLDDKHSDTSIDEHCQANFSDTRRMMQSIQAKWPDSLQFQEIILDYFFSPVLFTSWICTGFTLLS